MFTETDATTSETSDERFERRLIEAFSQIRPDHTPITDIHSYAMCEDGRTLSVYVDMPGGITRIFSFCEGEPVCITDHGGMH